MKGEREGGERWGTDKRSNASLGVYIPTRLLQRTHSPRFSSENPPTEKYADEMKTRVSVDLALVPRMQKGAAGVERGDTWQKWNRLERNLIGMVVVGITGRNSI